MFTKIPISKRRINTKFPFKMPFLDPIRDKLQIIGLRTPHSMQKCPFNARNLICLFIHGANIASNVGYLFSGTKDLMESTLSLFLLITAILTVSILIDLIWNMERLFEFIDSVEETVARSKLKRIHRKSLSVNRSNSSLIFSNLNW